LKIKIWKEIYQYSIEEGKSFILFIIVGILFLFGLKLYSGIGTEYSGLFPAIFLLSLGVGGIFFSSISGIDLDKKLFKDLENIVQDGGDYKECSRKRLLKYEQRAGTQKRAYRVCITLKEHFSDEVLKARVNEVVEIIHGWCSVEMRGWKFDE